VFFNGAKAEATFRRYVLPQIGGVPLSYRRLPSTSPANASLSPTRKLAAWRAILVPVTKEVS
jgi:G:T/U-mismatch repair DNA glycosylase